MNTFSDLTVEPPPPSVADWNDDGVVILPSFIIGDVIDAYLNEWMIVNGDEYDFDLMTPGEAIEMERRRGWPYDVPYTHHPALRRLVCDSNLAAVLEKLLGEPAGVHLNLSGWITTARNWHQDSYLNPPHVGDSYAAVWFALGDIHPDSGPFQYVPGSHRWPQVTREKISEFVDIKDPLWPKHSEAVLTDAFEAEIERRNADVVTYLPGEGDVLIWHGRLLHRGSEAVVPNAFRPALIAHYSGINHRPDMPAAVQHEVGGWFFPLKQTPA